MLEALIILILGSTKQTTLQNNSNYINDDFYYELPHFWSNTGFCPAGNIEEQKHIAATLLHDEALQMNLRYISTLPYEAITHIRIHWSLQLIKFVQYNQAGVPIYDFSDLDTFHMNLDDLNLSPVIEFMANPGDVFTANPSRNEFFWEDFTYQVVRHYLNTLGAAKLNRWRFETWNEPDLENYNRLNFTIEDYLTYVYALKRGLKAAGHRAVNSLYFALRGPAGLFKAPAQHPLCWHMLAQCNYDMRNCPLDTLTYHRKGNGKASELLETSEVLLKQIYAQYPGIKRLPISNDEADPISIWSAPQDFHEDVRYAVILTTIVIDHWHAKLKKGEFKNLESISHDNAFLSYHPYEFSQRTLLAHFRMNNSKPIHSQFIQKPVYAALGMLAKLGNMAADVEVLTATNGAQLCLLKSTLDKAENKFFSWLLLPQENATTFDSYLMQRKLPIEISNKRAFAYIIELLEQQHTDPAYVWQNFKRPAYPNASMREAMRRSQTPALHSVGLLKEAVFEMNIGSLQMPWLVLFRVCAATMSALKPAQNLQLTQITYGEVLVTWQEMPYSTQCLKSYEVWFQMSDTQGTNISDWQCITEGWHLPFPAFQYAPATGQVNGFYKVRGLDIFNQTSKYSKIVEYIDL